MSSYLKAFPRLQSGNYRSTSPATPNYNCIAWAAEDEERWWWPIPLGLGFWPPEALRVESVEAFLMAFGTLGYEVCESGELEPELQKVAMFVSDMGVPTHMARQLIDGTWTSKLGQSIDINHFHVDGVSGSVYGEPTVFMKRPRERPSLRRVR